MSKRAGTLLGAAGAILILLVIVLLWSLGGPPEREARRERRERTRPAAAAGTTLAAPPRNTASARATPPGFSTPSPAPMPVPEAAPDAGPAAAAADKTAGALTPVSAPGTHMAPAVIPAEIVNETDPARKAQLMRMHELAVSRSRASRLRRRARMLRATLATAKEQGSWNADKRHKVEQDLTELGSAIKLAEKNAKLAAQRAGIKE